MLDSDRIYWRGYGQMGAAEHQLRRGHALAQDFDEHRHHGQEDGARGHEQNGAQVRRQPRPSVLSRANKFGLSQSPIR